MGEGLGLNVEENIESIEKYTFKRPPIKGYPELRWTGKRPFNSTQYFPAQLKENHGEPVNGWMNEIFWGDNLQVMSHLLKKYRGKIKLVYIDPPFDSKADYKKKISLKGQQVTNDHNAFEEKQYTDIWSNDEYLQFIYERIILLKELLSENGSIFVHCDYHKSHLLKCILDEIFGQNNFLNEIIWKRKQATSYAGNRLGVATDSIFWYSKSTEFTYNPLYSIDDENTQKYIEERYRYFDENGRRYKLGDLGNSAYRPNLIYEYKGCNPPANGWAVSKERMEQMDKEGRLEFPKKKDGRLMRRQFFDEYKGQLIQNLWLDINIVNSQAKERLHYPTQKPEALLERILLTASNKGDIVFDCFMGSGTTQAVAMKLERKFIGADINLGAIQITTKRLLNTLNELKIPQQSLIIDDNVHEYYTGFSVYNVNNYDFFRNPVEAKELLIQALEIQPLPGNNVYDGEKDGRLVKLMPVNRIATRVDLNELITNFDYKTFEKKQNEAPTKPVEHLLLVCMGHEPDLKAHLENQTGFKLDVEIVDILRDKQELQFKRDAEAELDIKDGSISIISFYPMNLLQKLSLMKEKVKDWKELVESIMIDFNYDGSVFEPTLVDVPEKNDLVKGTYEIPEDAGTIRVKITDLLSESLEVDVNNG